MIVADLIATRQARLEQIRSRLDVLRADIAQLAAERDVIQAELAELRAFLDWKKTQP
jgi:hypothetical protein